MAAKAMVVRSPGLPQVESEGGQVSPSGSPKVVGTYSLQGVPVQWDNHPEIRERIRNNNSLVLSYNYEKGCGVSEYVNATMENVKLNSPVLMPLATLMAEHNLQLPAIDQLMTAVSEFFQLAKLSRTNDHFYQEAWAIRRLIGRMKKFTYRPAAPQDLLQKKHCYMKINFIIWCCW